MDYYFRKRVGGEGEDKATHLFEVVYHDGALQWGHTRICCDPALHLEQKDQMLFIFHIQ